MLQLARRTALVHLSKDVVDAFFRNDPYEGLIVDLLLNTESCAVMHVGETNTSPFRQGTYDLSLLGVNYTNGHSEGMYKIVVQDVEERRGPWVLYRPPGSKNKIFTLQDVSIPSLPGVFSKAPANIRKIDTWYIARGDAQDIFREFSQRGFRFNPSHPAAQNSLVSRLFRSFRLKA
jgi:hypothetical protein